MTRDIAIYGAGGFGREIACLIRVINENLKEPRWNLVGFFDDKVDKGTPVGHFGYCLGGMDMLNQWSSPLDICVAIGNGKTIESIIGKISNQLVEYPNVIHPNAVFIDSETFFIGKGNIIQSGCVFSCGVGIGSFNIFNGGVVLGHDDTIDSFNTFMPAVRVSGGVNVGCRNFFGIGSIILQNLTIADNTTLGAGSVLMTKPKAGFLYMGNPAKRTEF